MDRANEPSTIGAVAVTYVYNLSLSRITGFFKLSLEAHSACETVVRMSLVQISETNGYTVQPNSTKYSVKFSSN